MNEVAIAEPTRYKLAVHAYHRMAEAGIFGDNKRIELIDGELIDMAPIGQAHASLVGSLNQALVMACYGRGIVWPQSPVQLDGVSEPQPDLAVLRPRTDFYATGERVGPEDVLLVIEVADSSLRFDTTVKLPAYARAGIGEFWLVDVKRRVLDGYRLPQAGGYGQRTTHQPGERLALALAPEIVVSLDLVFG